MKVIIDKIKCDRCGACVAVCPHLAIDLSEYETVIQEDKCVACLLCVRSCPLGAITSVE